MAAKKPRIVIIGAGMAGLTAANKLYTCNKDMFDLCVVEGGTRIGGRVNTSLFCGDRIELGATWIHGIGGSPIHELSQQIHALDSDEPWECMDPLEDPKVVLEGGFQVNELIVDSVVSLFNNLMAKAQGRKLDRVCDEFTRKLISEASRPQKGLSIGAYLRQGLNIYWDSMKCQADSNNGYGHWSKKMVEEAIFGIHENIQRTYTSAGDLMTLDYEAESEYQMFPGDEITIAKGYSSIIAALASVLPHGVVQLGRRVTRIDWQPGGCDEFIRNGDAVGDSDGPVKLHFSDGSVVVADHVLVTVSLGVLKAGIRQDSKSSSGMLKFNPPLPFFKADAISRLGFGVVNKLFLQMSSRNGVEDCKEFPYLQLGFHRQESEFRDTNIPWWMRKTASMCPIYKNSSVLLSWFAGKEAIELENLTDDEIIHGVSTTISSFLPRTAAVAVPESEPCSTVSLPNSNGNVNGNMNSMKFSKVLKTKWSSDPLFLGSYSYVAVGSSGDDLDKLAEPLPSSIKGFDQSKYCPPLQLLFAGEATHRTHYSTTHGAYFSGLREANRLLKHYNYVGV